MPDDAELRARVWIAQVGRIPLLLLDSDIPENEHDLRSVTDRLYGGDQEHRIKQEILAGVGGVRAIRAFTDVEGLPSPEVFHMNEGHAGFLGVERIRELIDAGLDFDTALTVVRSSTVFTTHTPVPAGIDRFPVEMVKRYFGSPSADGPCGREFAAAARRPAGPHHRVRGRGRPVEVQHGAHGPAAGAAGERRLTAARRVSRGMFNELWPGFDPGEVPIGSITNGVHAPTWAAPQWLELGRELLGSEDLGSLREPDSVGAAASGRSRSHVVDPLAAAREAGRGRSCAVAPILAGAGRIGGRIGLDRNGVRSGRVDHRVRAAGPHVQAADADAARRGAAGEASARRGSADPADRRRQVASRRRRRKGVDPAGGEVRRPARGPAPHRVPARLRHVDGAPVVLRAATCG